MATDATSTRFIKFSSLKYHNAVQTFYVGSTYIYALQRLGEDAILSRCDMSGAMIDYMDLKRFGHSETLQWFSHGGKSYFWIGTKGIKTIESSTTLWATQLARIEYDPSRTYDNGNPLDYTEATRLSSVIRANPSGSADGSLTRFEAALSSNSDTPSGKEELLVLSINDSSPRHGTFTIYDNEALNNILDDQEAAGQLYTSFQDVTSAAITSFKDTSVYGKIPYASIQGLEFSNGRAIYYSSGKQGEQCTISKGSWHYSSLNKKTVYVGSVAATETEGMQLKGDLIYFGTSHYTDGAVSDNYIVSVPKSIF